MTRAEIRSSEYYTPKLIGGAFLIQAIFSLIATFLLTPLIEPGDMIGTMSNLANNVFQVRASIVSEMIAVIGIVILGSLLYLTLKKQNRIMALVALGLYLLTAGIIAASRIAAFALLSISLESILFGHPEYLQVLGNLFYALQDFGYFLHMLPYTFGATIFYYLFFKSGYLPRPLILLGLIAAPLAFIGTFFEHLGFNVPLFVYVPNMPFD